MKTTTERDGTGGIGSSKLLACPFCGETWCSVRNAGNNGVLRQVYCRDVDCGARGPARPSEQHAIVAWNNRTFAPLPEIHDGKITREDVITTLIELRDIQDALGHSHINTTMGYLTAASCGVPSPLESLAVV